MTTSYCIVGVLMKDEEFLAAVLEDDIQTEMDIIKLNNEEYIFGVLLSQLEDTEVGVLCALDIDEFRGARKELEDEIIRLSLDNIQDISIYNFIGEENDHIF